jgi:hypothetical protein
LASESDRVLLVFKQIGVGIAELQIRIFYKNRVLEIACTLQYFAVD